ncbi:MAG: tRNA threonylcarbamoyladenosine dehydratase [Firmicutes bacterium]|nr:tRNA threonylcarbamoyladenosine dehydratase [Bacillota bacterium]
MKEQFERSERVMGSAALSRLEKANVLLFGLGGVGSYVAEGLVRAGIGSITIVDKDRVDISNLNRQIPALHSTVGKLKTQVMGCRLRDINPDCRIEEVECFFMGENKSDIPVTSGDFDFSKYDYVVDAIDTVSAKIEIIAKASEAGVPVISSMGTGGKLDPSRFTVTTIEKTKVCPLAKAVRKELKRRGISGTKVIYSEEEPKGVGGSVSFVPSVAGLMIAGEVVKDLINDV